MDRGSVRALKHFMNVGYTLGFLPYYFQVLAQQVKDTNLVQLEPPNPSWFGEGQVDGEGDKDVSEPRLERKGGNKGQRLCSSLKTCRFYAGRKIKILFRGRNGIQITAASNNLSSDHSGDNQDFDTQWKIKEGSKSRWWLLIWSIFLQFVYECFLIYRSYEVYCDDKIPAKDKLPIYYLTVTLVLLSFFALLCVKEYDQVHVCLNAVRDTVAHIRNNEPANGRVHPVKQRSIKLFAYSALALGLFVGAARSLNVFLSPGSKLVITSLAEDPTRLPLWLRILAAVFHFQVAGFSTYMCWFFGLTLPWYVASILPVIQQTRPDSTTQDSIYKSYNMLSVLQMHFSQVYGSVTLAHEVTCVFVTVFNIFRGVVHGTFSGFVIALILMHLQNNFYSRLGALHTASVESIKTWGEQNNGEINWFTKFQRSVRPLRIYIGSFFFVDKSFILTLTSIILDQSVNLILSYK